MKNKYIIPVLLLVMGTFFGIIGFASYIKGLIVGGIYFLVAVGEIAPRINMYNVITHRQKTGYQFMNNFLITLSVHRNISDTYEIIEKQFSGELAQWMQNLEGVMVHEKISQLANYFQIDIYPLFIDFLQVYEHEGGEVLQMAEYLLTSIRQNTAQLTSYDALYGRKMMEFILLWLMTFAILLTTRFSLGAMYQTMLTSLTFQILLGCLFLLFISALVILMRVMFRKHNFQGDKQYGKMGAKIKKSWFQRKKD